MRWWPPRETFTGSGTLAPWFMRGLPGGGGAPAHPGGGGIPPARRPAYDAAFVMLAQQGFPERVPPWGIRVLLDEDELIQADACPDTLSEEDHT